MNETSLPDRTAEAAQDFSIVLGGPLFQLYRRAHLVGSDVDLLKRRLLGISLFAWLPMLVLAIVEGHATGNTAIPFLKDIDVHARCLVSIPLLILAEFVVHKRLAGVVRQFTDRKLIAPEDVPRFDEIKASAFRLRNSIMAEVVQLALAVGLYWLWGSHTVIHAESWIGTPKAGGGLHYTAAGAWYAFVALSIFRFLIFRWYFRVFIWYRFLWQVARMPLRLDAMHPDRAGGLGFLAGSPAIFTPLFLAHSVFVAAVIQNKIWGTGATLMDFRIEIGVLISFLAILALTPLCFFAAKLAVAKRKGNAEYGALASRYVAGFREKWLSGSAPSADLIGSGDIQSLADLSNAYDAVRETRLFPITRQSIVQLIIVAGLPLVPLALNLLSWQELLQRVVGFLF